MDKRIILYILLGLVILGLVLVTLFPNMIYAWKDAGKSGEDLCATPAGKTDEAWIEHMSHHPNVYAECL